MAYSTAAKPHHNTLDMRQHTFGNRMFFMFIGLLIVGLGILAIAHPFLTTLATKIFIGWMFLFVGIGQIFQSFSTRGWSEFALNLLIGFLYAAVGGWLIFFPLAGVLTLTVVLAATFIAQGAIEIVMGFRMRGSGGWFALLLADAVAMTLGVMICLACRALPPGHRPSSIPSALPLIGRPPVQKQLRSAGSPLSRE